MYRDTVTLPIVIINKLSSLFEIIYINLMMMLQNQVYLKNTLNDNAENY